MRGSPAPPAPCRLRRQFLVRIVRPHSVGYSRRAWLTGLVAAAGSLVAGCSVNLSDMGLGSREPAQPAQPSTTVGSGEVRTALILPFSASGNAGLAAQAMKNAAEMALADFNPTNIQLLVKDDAG